jgi:hypothetical protein
VLAFEPLLVIMLVLVLVLVPVLEPVLLLVLLPVLALAFVFSFSLRRRSFFACRRAQGGRRPDGFGIVVGMMSTVAQMSRW